MNARNLSVKFATLSLVVLATATAFAGQSAIGKWALPVFSQGPLTITSTMTIEQSLITATSTCTVNGQSASVEVSSPITMTETQITTLASAQKSVNVNGVECNASVSPSTMDYSVSADQSQLTLSQGGQSFTLPRAQ